MRFYGQGRRRECFVAPYVELDRAKRNHLFGMQDEQN